MSAMQKAMQHFAEARRLAAETQSILDGSMLLERRAARAADAVRRELAQLDEAEVHLTRAIARGIARGGI